MASFDSPPAVGEILAQKRLERGLSLQSLAKISGVSKSMISQVENGQVNPTLAVVWKIAGGLGVSLNDLLGEESDSREAFFVSLTSQNCPTLTSADSSYQIQILSGIDMVEKVELYLVDFKPGGEMASEAHAKGTVETLTVMKGDVEVILNKDIRHKVRQFQSCRYSAAVPHSIRACGKRGAVVYLVVKFERY